MSRFLAASFGAARSWAIRARYRCPVPGSDTRLQRRALDRAYDLAADQVNAGTVPFVILGVADARGVIRLEAVTSPRAPDVGVDSVCLLASITKPIVATAVLQLVETGQLWLNAPLEQWLPELAKPAGQPFTVWHVLTHTTGIEDVDLEDLIAGGGGRDELLRRMVAAAPGASPGSRYRYASFTFDLLAEAVGRAIRIPLETLLRERLLEPLDMADTTFDPRPEHAKRVAPIGVGGWDGTRRADIHDLEQARRLVDGYTDLHLAGGGLWSTAHDLLRFGRAMLRGGELDGVRILSPAFVELSTREVTVGGLGAAPDRLADEHYALGWGKPGVASPASPSAFGHGGVSGTRLWIDPGHDLVFVYLSGAWGLPPEPIDAVANAIYAALA